MSSHTFSQLLDDIRWTKSRDPRDTRLASVATALHDVLREKGNDALPANMFVEAYVALDGTLLSEYDTISQLSDGLLTQTALLKLMEIASSFVDTPILHATLPKVNRLLSGLVETTLFKADADASGMLMTTDDLGPGISLLRVVCTLVSTLVEKASKANTSFHTTNLEQLLKGTLFRILESDRSGIHLYAESALSKLLRSEFQPCHSLVSTLLNSYVLHRLSPKSLSTSSQARYANSMKGLRLAKIALSGQSRASIGERIMVVLVEEFGLLSDEQKSNPPNQRKAPDGTLLINSILSTLIVLLEIEDSQNGPIDTFAARALATLLQVNAFALFRNSEPDVADSSCSVFGQALLCATERVLQSDYEKGVRLLPLTIDLLLRISRVCHHESFVEMVDAHFAQLTQIIRFVLPVVKSRDASKHDTCCKSCIHLMRSLLVETHQHCWRSTLASFCTLLEQLDPADAEILSAIKEMVVLRQRMGPGNETVVLEGVIGRVVQYVGVETSWNAVDLSTLTLSAPPGSFSWLIRAMKVNQEITSDVPVRLDFFCHDVLGLARQYDILVAKDTESSIPSREYVLLLWGLFPSFCTRPVRNADSLKRLGPILVKAMKDHRYPELIPIVATGLKTMCRVVDKQTDSEKVLQEFAEQFLPSLLKLIVYEDTSAQKEAPKLGRPDTTTDQIAQSRESSLTVAIESMAGQVPRARLKRMFARVMQRLLERSQLSEDNSAEIALLLSATQGLVMSNNLDPSSISMLYRGLKPLARSDEMHSRVQKRVYKLLAEICKNREFLQCDGLIEDLTSFLQDSSKTSHMATRQMRLKCIFSLLENSGMADLVSQQKDKLGKNPPGRPNKLQSEAFVFFALGETLLALKDSNKRTRELGYKMLLCISEMVDDATKLLSAIASALASESPHMRSAAIMGLSWVVHKNGKHDQKVHELVQDMLGTVMLLTDDSSQEVWKSVVGFIRVLVVACPRTSYEPLVPDIVSCLLKYNRGREKFRGKIKIILTKLVSYFGFEHLENVFPQGNEKLLRHLRKMSERASRPGTEQVEPEEMGSLQDMFASDDEGSVETGSISARTKWTTKTSSRKRASGHRNALSPHSVGVDVRIQNDSAGQDFDLGALTRRYKQSQEVHQREDDSDESTVFDESGRLVVTETMGDQKDQPPATLGKVPHQPTKEKSKQKAREQPKIGGNYKARKAGGDVKRKGQRYDPYAYVPLDGRNYTRKNRRQAVENMDSVVRRGRKRVKI